MARAAVGIDPLHRAVVPPPFAAAVRFDAVADAEEAPHMLGAHVALPTPIVVPHIVRHPRRTSADALDNASAPFRPPPRARLARVTLVQRRRAPSAH